MTNPLTVLRYLLTIALVALSACAIVKFPHAETPLALIAFGVLPLVAMFTAGMLVAVKTPQ